MYKLSALFVLFVIYVVQAQNGVARFDTGGVEGSIYFTLLGDGSVQIRTMFSNLPFSYALPYHVHEYPVDYRLLPTTRCGSTGGHHDPTGRLAAFGGLYSQYCNQNNRSACEEGDLSGKFGRLVNGSFMYTDDNLSTNGRYGILYRSVVIHRVDGNSAPRYVCASIEPTTSLSESITAKASFYGRAISGDIYFFQQQGSSMSTQIYANLYTVGTARSLTALEWSVKVSPPGYESRRGGCSRVGTANFNPSQRAVANCDASMANTCPEYALTTKHGSLAIEASGNQYFFTEVSGISLYGSNSIIGRSITFVRGGSEIIACAAIEQVSSIVLQGSIPNGFAVTATQYYPFSAARVATSGDRASLTTLSLQARGYIANAECVSSSDVFNPFPANPNTPAGAQVTRDVGPLGNFLTQIPANNMETIDTSTLPLSGPYSAAERTLYYVNGANTGCVNFGYYLGGRTDNAFVIRAYGTFSDVADCRIHFTQLVTGTSYLPTGSVATNPNFLSGDVLITDNCTKAMTRDYRFIEYSGQCTQTFYNPYLIDDANAQYASECTRVNQRRCLVGDNLAQDTDNMTRSVVDTNLELAGAYGVASDGVRVRVLGQYCAAVRAEGQMSATYTVQDCEQFNSRISNAIEGCSGVGANNFLSINCTDNNAGPMTVTVNTVFGSANNADAQACIASCLNAGNRLVVPLVSLLIGTIISIIFI